MPIRLRLRAQLLLTALATCLLTQAQNVGINVTGAAPNPAAMLDLDVSGIVAAGQAKRGLLIPRMTEAQRLAITTTAADNGLLVYQTDVGASNDTTNARGLWYYDANTTPHQWRHLSHAMRSWRLIGNNVTSVTTGTYEFLGTRTASIFKELWIRSVPEGTMPEPAWRMGFEPTDVKAGFVGLGTPAAATERLEVNGGIRLNAPPVGTTAPPARRGSMRYGTYNTAAPTAANPNAFWGTLDTIGTTSPLVSNDPSYWAQMDNAENLLTPPRNYVKDTVACQGVQGDAQVGVLSPTPVTNTSSSPANIYSPFATNYGTLGNGKAGHYRVQYIYTYAELVEAGICFPATITGVAFFCLDQETLSSAYGPTTLTGEIRAGAASGNATLTGTAPYFGIQNNPGFDNSIRISPVRGGFVNLIPSPGWITFPFNNSSVTLNVNENLIVDIQWGRSTGTPGVGPKVELQQTDRKMVKWVINPTGSGTLVDRNALTDVGIMQAGQIPSNFTSLPQEHANDPHNYRPVTRFTATVVSHSTVTRQANILQYDGSVHIGSDAWANSTPFRGPGNVKAQRGVYDGTMLLSDHVFDRYFDGVVKPADQASAMGYAYVGLPQLRETLAKQRHLPNMPSREQWEASGGASLGKLATGLWQTVEDQALYISELEKDLAALEQRSFGEQLQPEQAEALIKEIQESKRLTPPQKEHLVQAIRQKTAQPAKP